MSSIERRQIYMGQNDSWKEGEAPIAVVMISLNEGHNMIEVLHNLQGWAQEVFLVDSYSSDDTVDIALSYGVHVVQRRFRGFGDQWNFSLGNLPITAPWTMKLDPDERLSDKLKDEIVSAIAGDLAVGIACDRQLFFMGRKLPIKQEITRVWKTGFCEFTNVTVNEHPIVKGKVIRVEGWIEHHDSPDLDHWFEKQNRYSTSEAESKANGVHLGVAPKLFGTWLERRMWVKRNFDNIPFRFFGVFLYLYFFKGLWRAGWVGYAWSRLRAQVYMMRFFKLRELRLLGRNEYARRGKGAGLPDSRVPQFD